ncbi:hypothetical protein N0V88_004700 [Collariella sp. IMI 366227]|nr:hypothetical protein N0V88_004700 [Collariella sp. IMI 366227]
MNNFGVIEIASTTTKSTPGWAYVPDTGPALSSLQPTNRKRAARNQPALSLSDLPKQILPERDADPLLVSSVPPFPDDAELRALMTALPLSYLEARAAWGDEESRYPARVFCAVCGYWGKVKCMKCGIRVCALECLETHREECVTRYGL